VAATIRDVAHAEGISRSIVSRALSVPGQLSIVGFDDIGMSAMTHPALTTVSAPKHEAGRATVAVLLQLLEGAGSTTAPHRELATQLIVRATTGVVPAPDHRAAEVTR